MLPINMADSSGGSMFGCRHNSDVHGPRVLQSDGSIMHPNLQYFLGSLLHTRDCQRMEREPRIQDRKVFACSPHPCRFWNRVCSSRVETLQRRRVDLLDCTCPQQSRTERSQLRYLSSCLFVCRCVGYYCLPRRVHVHHLFSCAQARKEA